MDLPIELKEALFYGNGRHKRCYLHPHNDARCIKMAYSADGQKDLDREIKYLKVLKNKGKNYDVLPKYFGTVETNLGTGYIYELIADDGGTKSLTLEDYLHNETLLRNNLQMIITELNKLKNALIDNEIITMDIFPENIIVQYGGHRRVIKCVLSMIWAVLCSFLWNIISAVWRNLKFATTGIDL